MGFLKTICDKQQNAKYRNFDTFGFFWVITMKKAKTKKNNKGDYFTDTCTCVGCGGNDNDSRS